MVNKKKILEWIKTILVLGIILFIVGGIVWIFLSVAIQDKKEFKQCLKYSGEEYSWTKGRLGYNIDNKNFNLTHFACCKDVHFIDDNGQIQKYKCEVLLERD